MDSGCPSETSPLNDTYRPVDVGSGCKNGLKTVKM